jgi:hypothetical protein
MQHYMKEAGCVECDDKVYLGNQQLYTSNRNTWRARTNSQATIFAAQAIRGLIDLGGVDGLTTEEDAHMLIAELRDELATRDVNHTVVRAWGRKPLES